MIIGSKYLRTTTYVILLNTCVGNRKYIAKVDKVIAVCEENCLQIVYLELKRREVS